MDTLRENEVEFLKSGGESIEQIGNALQVMLGEAQLTRDIDRKRSERFRGH